MDSIFIEGLEIDSLIGVYEHERQQRQALRFDLELGFDNRKPAQTDRIGDTLDYAKVCERLRGLVEASEFQLVETMAEHCCATLLREFPAERIRLRVAKTGVLPRVARVGVQIERVRADVGEAMS